MFVEIGSRNITLFQIRKSFKSSKICRKMGRYFKISCPKIRKTTDKSVELSWQLCQWRVEWSGNKIQSVGGNCFVCSGMIRVCVHNLCGIWKCGNLTGRKCVDTHVHEYTSHIRYFQWCSHAWALHRYMRAH